MSFTWYCPCGHKVCEKTSKLRNTAIRRHLAGQDWKLCWDPMSSLSWIVSSGTDDFVITEGACPLVQDVFGKQNISNRENYLSNGIINCGKVNKDYVGTHFKQSITYTSECFCCGKFPHDLTKQRFLAHPAFFFLQYICFTPPKESFTTRKA